MSSGPGEDPLQSLKAEFNSFKENSELYGSFAPSGTVRGNRNRVFQCIKPSVAVVLHGKIYQKILKLHQGFN
jgi:hypothetical protein